MRGSTNLKDVIAKSKSVNATGHAFIEFNANQYVNYDFIGIYSGMTPTTYTIDGATGRPAGSYFSARYIARPDVSKLDPESDIITYAMVDEEDVRYPELFPLEHIFKPNRPSPGIVKLSSDAGGLGIQTWPGPHIPTKANTHRYYPATSQSPFKYWRSANVSSGGQIDKASPFIHYSKEIWVNSVKVTVQTYNAIPSVFKLQYLPSIQAGATWTDIYTNTDGVFPASGELQLYYNGASWSTTPSYIDNLSAQTLSVSNRSSSGTVRTLTVGAHRITSGQSVIVSGVSSNYNGKQTVTGITGTTITYTAAGVLNESTASSGSVLDQANAVKVGGMRLAVSYLDSSPSALEVIELSPRLLIDVTSSTSSFDTNYNISEDDSPILIGSISSQTGSLQMIDYDNLLDFNEDTSVLYNYGSKGANVQLVSRVYGSTLGGGQEDTRVAYLYIDQWTEDSSKNISVDLMDFVRYFQDIKAPVAQWSGKTLTQIIRRLADWVGFSNIVYYKQSETASEDPVIPMFLSDGKSTIYDVLRDLAEAFQSGMFIDADNVLRIYSKEKLLYAAAAGSTQFALTYNQSGDLQPNIKEVISINEGQPVNDVRVDYKRKYLEYAAASQDEASKPAWSMQKSADHDDVWTGENQLLAASPIMQSVNGSAVQSYQVATNVVTVTCLSENMMVTGQYVLIEGIPPYFVNGVEYSINGTHLITSFTASNLSFNLTSPDTFFIPQAGSAGNYYMHFDQETGDNLPESGYVIIEDEVIRYEGKQYSVKIDGDTVYTTHWVDSPESKIALKNSMAANSRFFFTGYVKILARGLFNSIVANHDAVKDSPIGWLAKRWTANYSNATITSGFMTGQVVPVRYYENTSSNITRSANHSMIRIVGMSPSEVPSIWGSTPQDSLENSMLIYMTHDASNTIFQRAITSVRILGRSAKIPRGAYEYGSRGLDGIAGVFLDYYQDASGIHGWFLEIEINYNVNVLSGDYANMRIVQYVDNIRHVKASATAEITPDINWNNPATGDETFASMYTLELIRQPSGNQGDSSQADTVVGNLYEASGALVKSIAYTDSSPNSLGSGGIMQAGDQLISTNTKYQLAMQADGNAVEYTADGRVINFNTNTWGNPGSRLIMQTDGNLALYSVTGAPLWYLSATPGITLVAGSRLVMQDDGNLVIYGPSGQVVKYWGVDPAPPANWGIQTFAEASSPFTGVFVRGNTYADFDYFMASGRRGEVYDGERTSSADFGKSSGLYNLQHGGLVPQTWMNSRWRTMFQPISVVQNRSSEPYIYSEFGPIAHELKIQKASFGGEGVINPELVNGVASDKTGFFCPTFTSNPFSAEFIIVNASRHQISCEGLKITGIPIKSLDLTYNVDDFLSELSGSKNFQKHDFIKANLQRSKAEHGVIGFTISSDYIQSESAARSMLEYIIDFGSYQCDVVEVEVFGNPLLEPADVCSINLSPMEENGYNGTQKFIVKSAKHSYDAGFTTTLKLRRIT